MMIIDWLLALLLLPMTGAAALVALQVTMHLRRRGTAGKPDTAGPRASAVVLMPAHQEEAVIAPSVRSVLADLRAGDRLVVIADNCTDRTAEVARAAGAEVVVRHDTTLRGKGHALAFGLESIRVSRPDYVLIVDADCTLAFGSVDALCTQVAALDRPAQALDLMEAGENAGVAMRMSAFAWRLRNWVRPSGGAAMGWPCQLMGTGMAFAWAHIEQANLASSSIVEDMELGLRLAAQGRAPRLCEAALVTSRFPASAAAAQVQRTRWEHGHLQTILQLGWPALRQGLANRQRELLLLALDMMVPPLAFLCLGLLASAAAGVALALHTGQGAALAVSGFGLLLMVWAVMSAWRSAGRDLVSLAEWAALPIYLGRKLPIYARLLWRREQQWRRTERDRD